MQSQDVAPRPAASSSDPAVDVERAEAALVEHYPRLVRLAYLVLPPSLGRNRRVVTAHALTQRALPKGRAQTTVVPAQSTGRDGDPGYAVVRLQVLRNALEAGRPLPCDPQGGGIYYVGPTPPKPGPVIGSPAR